jgi:hypothetical protein
LFVAGAGGCFVCEWDLFVLFFIGAPACTTLALTTEHVCLCGGVVQVGKLEAQLADEVAEKDRCSAALSVEKSRYATAAAALREAESCRSKAEAGAEHARVKAEALVAQSTALEHGQVRTPAEVEDEVQKLLNDLNGLRDTIVEKDALLRETTEGCRPLSTPPQEHSSSNDPEQQLFLLSLFPSGPVMLLICGVSCTHRRRPMLCLVQLFPLSDPRTYPPHALSISSPRAPSSPIHLPRAGVAGLLPSLKQRSVTERKRSAPSNESFKQW